MSIILHRVKSKTLALCDRDQHSWKTRQNLSQPRHKKRSPTHQHKSVLVQWISFSPSHTRQLLPNPKPTSQESIPKTDAVGTQTIRSIVGVWGQRPQAGVGSQPTMPSKARQPETSGARQPETSGARQ
ncbi:MAG: hypothetical protein CL920_23725 [Deltaproteobacteria bacterium]|nr:hypothetical protein [Deltaproteobacteria bacterium]